MDTKSTPPTRPTRSGQRVLTAGGSFATTMSPVSQGGSIEIVYEGERTPMRLPASSLTVVTVDDRPMYDFTAPTTDPKTIRAVDIPADKLVSIPEADQIDPAQPKRDYLQEALDVIQAEMDGMTSLHIEFIKGRRSGLHAAISILEGKIEQRDAR